MDLNAIIIAHFLKVAHHQFNQRKLQIFALFFKQSSSSEAIKHIMKESFNLRNHLNFDLNIFFAQLTNMTWYQFTVWLFFDLNELLGRRIFLSQPKKVELISLTTHLFFGRGRFEAGFQCMVNSICILIPLNHIENK